MIEGDERARRKILWEGEMNIDLTWSEMSILLLNLKKREFGHRALKHYCQSLQIYHRRLSSAEDSGEHKNAGSTASDIAFTCTPVGNLSALRMAPRDLCQQVNRAVIS